MSPANANWQALQGVSGAVTATVEWPKPEAGGVPAENRPQIEGILCYLIEVHGTFAAGRWFEGGTPGLVNDGDPPLERRGRDAALPTDRLLERLGSADIRSPR